MFFMKSIWQEKIRPQQYPKLQENKKTEVLVIGGGMAGILCALKLQEAGKDVILLEANRIGAGITAKTTAVLTAQHDFLYQDMIRSFNEETAKAYLHGNLDAITSFRELSKKIPCDFEDMPSVQFTTGNTDKLRREAETVNRLGFPAAYKGDWSFPHDTAGAVEYPGMAQVHPLKFLYGAAKELTIYEDSRVLNLSGTTAQLENCSVDAKQVIVATHFPFINRHGAYFMKLYQSRSYVIAIENVPDPGASLAELDGHGMYFRRYGKLLLVGGADHRTGKKTEGFAYLRKYIQSHFPKAEEKFAWANQDCMSLDGLPYVGMYSPNMPGVYVATGFNAWGMSNSMVAATVLTDQIMGRENPLTHILRPNRPVLKKQLFYNVGATIEDFAIPTTKRCPHLGCALRWNPQEHSWDCPCHGSRFEENGKLLDTPAQKDANI